MTFQASPTGKPARRTLLRHALTAVVAIGLLAGIGGIARADDGQRRGRKYLAAYIGVMGPQDGVDIVVRYVTRAGVRLETRNRLFGTVVELMLGTREVTAK